MLEDLTVFSAFMLGLLGSTHCLGMCGGIANALTYAAPTAKTEARQRFKLQLCHNIGRISTYIVLGIVVSLFGIGFVKLFGDLGIKLLRSLSGCLLIITGLAIVGMRGMANYFERFGAKLWRYIAPLTRSFLPITNLRNAFIVGSLWGMLPCGLLYSVIALAGTTSDVQLSALMMLSFGLGTLPAMLSLGIASNALYKYLKIEFVRTILGSAIMLFGGYSLIMLYTAKEVCH